MIPDSQDELLDVAALAARWRLPPQHIRQRICENRMPVPIVRLGPRLPRFRLSDVAAYEKRLAREAARAHHAEE